MRQGSRRRAIALVAAACLPLVLADRAAAQEAPARPLVRVHAPSVVGGVLEGRATRLGDTLLVAPVGGAPLRVPLSAVTRLEARVGASRGRGALRGLLVGALSGAAAGALLPVEDCGPDGRDPDKICTRRESVGFSALGFGAVGAAIGALIPVGIWREVSPLALTLAPARADGRVAGRLVVRLAPPARR